MSVSIRYAHGLDQAKKAVTWCAPIPIPLKLHVQILFLKGRFAAQTWQHRMESV
jgi:hypothetical protein